MVGFLSVTGFILSIFLRLSSIDLRIQSPALRIVLQRGLERGECCDLAYPILGYPPFVDFLDRDGVQKVKLFAPRFMRDDEVCFFQHPQMLHHPEAGHLQPGLQFLERASVTLEQEIEQETTRRIGERFEYGV